MSQLGGTHLYMDSFEATGHNKINFHVSISLILHYRILE